MAASRTGNAWDEGDAGAAMLAANINPSTGLATDYLNHFNEITMLIGLVADMPEIMDDILAWRPATYEEHFERSGFTSRALAIAAYRAAPEKVTDALLAAVAALDAAVLRTVAALEAAPPSAYGRIVLAGEAAIRPLMGRAAGIIHGIEFDEDQMPEASQVAIDALLE